jgi:acetamidase/formamidase
MEATKDAMRGMIRYLRQTWGISAEEAYILCSVCADLKRNEVVDFPNWVVSACVPLSIFQSKQLDGDD